ncbi:hypothetical protein OG948_58965 (plasmid) [Embleya sp. NBC_00888]|uniref:hypothetical protein n=1 Tax=Embleya sp. NBC_00888 TaxID=2975960 RepID=UPI0038682B1E|nr:hypothetical protein OG948_58965 [Embleya sp. NBC_00888]
MLESLRRRFTREPLPPIEYIIPRPRGAETRGIDIWDVRLRPGAVVPAAAVSWWAASPGVAAHPVAVGLSVAATAFMGRSTIRWARIRLR